jgi:hypothetical protein
MKKLFILAILCATSAAFADPAAVATTNSSAIAAAQGGQQQQQASSGVTSAGNSSVTVGCLVNCADTSSGTKDLAEASVAVATINAQAARDVAATSAAANRDAANSLKPINNTPSIGLGQLTSSNDTCMGSVSVGGSGPGFSIGIGSTYTDNNCIMLKNSRELWNMGMKGAAMALMCNDRLNREALELTGYICPQTERDKKAAEAAAAK